MPGTPDRTDATHRLLVRGEGHDRVDAANAAAEAALAVGDTAFLSVRDVDDLADLSPHSARILREGLERVRPDERVNGGNCPEFRADLPADADAVLRALTVAGDLPHGEASWRAWEVYALVVCVGDEWCYYAVPHHGQWFLRADVAPSLPERVAEAVAPYPAAVVPTDPVVEWEGGRYAVDHRGLYVGERRYQFDLLKRAVIDPDRAAVEFEWLGPYERPTGSSGLGGAVFDLVLTTVLLPLELLTDRPGRVEVGDAETAERVGSALERVVQRVGYDYDVVRR